MLKTGTSSALQNTKLKVICFFLVMLVVGMFVITLTGTRSPWALNYEEQVLNKYSAWAEEIQEKEEYLRHYVRELEEQGITVPDWKETVPPIEIK